LASERRKDLQTNCIPWLVNQINKVMILENGEEEVDAISELISEINGFGTSKPSEKEWKFKTATIKIVEDSSKGGIGGMIWNSSVVFSSLIDEGKIVMNSNSNILELGCGTGLSGLMCAKLNPKQVVLSDFDEVVIDNAKKNIEVNESSHNMSTCQIDWNDYMDIDPEDVLNYLNINEVELDDNGKFMYKQRRIFKPYIYNTVIAADVLYDFKHAYMVPKVINYFLEKDLATSEEKEKDNEFKDTPWFHRTPIIFVVVPIRYRFENEIPEFENNMKNQNFKLLYEEVLRNKKEKEEALEDMKEEEERINFEREIDESNTSNEPDPSIHKFKFYIYCRN
jgi:predicted nicotinamide N-methyase